MRPSKVRPIISTVASIFAAVCLSSSVSAQNGGWQPLPQLESGTTVAVRTTQPIDVKTPDGRVFIGTVDEDVIDVNGRVAIPRGSTAELMVRTTTGSDLVVDLDSVTVNGQRYAVLANPATVGTSGTLNNGAPLGANQTTAEYVGGGALLGALIGAIAGGGKGAAVGAAVGAAAGAGTQIVTQGQSVTVPAESLLTFRLQRPLTLGVPDTGYTRDGSHYHRY